MHHILVQTDKVNQLIYLYRLLENDGTIQSTWYHVNIWTSHTSIINANTESHMDPKWTLVYSVLASESSIAWMSWKQCNSRLEGKLSIC